MMMWQRVLWTADTVDELEELHVMSMSYVEMHGY